MPHLRRRRFFTLAGCVGLLAGLAASAVPAAAFSSAPRSAASTADWTVMVYISGDNNLEKYVVNDLEDELGAIGSTAQVQVVALADRGPGFDTRRGDWTSTKLFHVTQGMRANAAHAVADWGERDMGNARTLTRFVRWTKANYPADHYAMYFWGHGWSWHPGWVLEDDTDRGTLDLDEVERVLPALGYFDVVGYDGCNMASIEVMDLWRGHAGAVTGSQEWVGWEGLEYDVILGDLQADPGMSARQLAVSSSASATTEKTWSAVGVRRSFDRLVAAVDDWARVLKRAVPDHRSDLREAFARTRSYWQAKMDKDLDDLAKTIGARVDDRTVRARGRDVMRAVDAVVLHEHHAKNKAGSHGITIYGPGTDKQRTDHRYYRNLGFAQATRWDEFLEAFHPGGP